MNKTCNCCHSGKVVYKITSEIHVQSLNGLLDYYLPNPDIETQYYCQKHMDKYFGDKNV